VLQAEKMDRTIAGFTIRAAQVQAVNPLLILVLVPLFTYVIYPTVERFVPFSPLWRVAVGLGLTVAGFAIAAAAQAQIDAGGTPGITWQLAAYLVITAAEVMVSVTCLEFSYTQAPRELKSFVMSLYLLSVSLGNEFTSLVNWFIENPDGSVKLEGAAYYWFFTIVMLVAAVLFVPVAWFYRGQTYIQEEAPAETTAGSAAE
jgi:POT family proton-dependent oligopeptide transporter